MSKFVLKGPGKCAGLSEANGVGLAGPPLMSGLYLPAACLGLWRHCLRPEDQSSSGMWALEETGPTSSLSEMMAGFAVRQDRFFQPQPTIRECMRRDHRLPVCEGLSASICCGSEQGSNEM